jgi:hypothetical protein
MRSPTRTSTSAAAFALLLATPSLAQHGDVTIYSTANGGGALAVDFESGTRQIVTNRLPGGVCPGGACFYSSTDPGFMTPRADRAGEGLFALNEGTPISFVVQAIAAGTSVKFGSSVADMEGEAIRIGVVDLHEHPEWQVEARTGVVADSPVTFFLRDTSGSYDDSAPLTLVLTNNSAPPMDSPTPTPTSTPQPTPIFAATTPPIATASPSPTPTLTTTATPTNTPDPRATPTPTLPPPPCVGDCDTNGHVSVNELVVGVGIALGTSSMNACDAFDPDRSGQVEVPELVMGVDASMRGCLPGRR